MDLEKIGQILESVLPDDLKEKKILDIMAEDNRCLEYMLFMLNSERTRKKNLISEMNVLISQTDTILENPKLNKDGFFTKKIKDFFTNKSGKDGIFHCFKAD